MVAPPLKTTISLSGCVQSTFNKLKAKVLSLLKGKHILKVLMRSVKTWRLSETFVDIIHCTQFFTFNIHNTLQTSRSSIKST